ncbi:alpha-ketoglutarate-dependent dioxygenase AlkB [Pontibacter sp. G13]|uniref:alpha-ketoglutarate-dependent dioxygenase AlkB family protein n=1 Tax=Pontibacter sp. G13 TaxID=3074898 RepID=UPI002889A5D5|nr:alpha-ketoglutarate-dependent dioxygenase AlkB [Pontibacter sp. G13]WNJ16018.1 alpha-ketoglutarate-dependent dioxygenase AlkB [Pontibacter sp. G13]
MREKLPIVDGNIWYDPHFLSMEEASSCMEILSEEIHWEQSSIQIFGKWVPQPRLIAWYGDPHCTYSYSNLTLEPNSWHPVLAGLREKLEEECQTPFNCVLLNLYRDGQDRMGWHSDDEPELGEDPAIASISLGSERRFHLRHKLQKERAKIRLDLAHGSLLYMSGKTQAHWQHQISKTKRQVGPRINLTYRFIPPTSGSVSQ